VRIARCADCCNLAARCFVQLAPHSSDISQQRSCILPSMHSMYFFFPSHFIASSQLVELVHKMPLVLGSALNTRGSVRSAVPSPHTTCSSRLCRQSALTSPALLLRTQPVATCGDTQPATPGAQPWFCDPAMGLAQNPNAASYPNPSNAVRLHPPFTLLQDVCMPA
jgi:hypothetical protein